MDLLALTLVPITITLFGLGVNAIQCLFNLAGGYIRRYKRVAQATEREYQMKDYILETINGIWEVKECKLDAPNELYFDTKEDAEEARDFFNAMTFIPEDEQ